MVLAARADSGNRELDRSRDRTWVRAALARMHEEAAHRAETPMHVFPLPPEWQIRIYLKDESQQPTGSLKHRLAWSLIVFGLCNGLIHEGTPLVEASSGSTAVSEAAFARLLGLPFVAVLPATTSAEKLDLIEREGGRCHLVDAVADVDPTARRLAADLGGHYLEQFTYAEQATDWRGETSLAASIFRQMQDTADPIPRWVTVGAGTGGTSATLGRYIRHRMLDTRVAVVDPEGSAFYPAWASGDLTVTAAGSAIEGIGRPRCEPSFVGSVVDRMIQVPDAASVAALRLLEDRVGLRAGGSSGTALVGALRLVAEMRERGERGAVVSVICDGGERYAQTYYDDTWLTAQGWDVAGAQQALDAFLTDGSWRLHAPVGARPTGDRQHPATNDLISTIRHASPADTKGTR